MAETLTDTNSLMNIKNKIAAYYPSSKKFSKGYKQAIERLERFALSQNVYKDDWFNHIRISNDKLRFFQDAFRNYEELLEMEESVREADRTKLSWNTVVEEYSLRKVFDWAKLEARMANFGAADRVMVIGSGPFPQTAIAYANLFGCKVTCVDKNRKAVSVSRKLIQKLGLSEQISVIVGQGNRIDVSTFDKILVTGQARPKREIFMNLEKADADIIARTTFGSSQLIYRPIDSRDIEQFKIRKRLTQWNKSFLSSLFLTLK